MRFNINRLLSPLRYGTFPVPRVKAKYQYWQNLNLQPLYCVGALGLTKDDPDTEIPTNQLAWIGVFKEGSGPVESKTSQPRDWKTGRFKSRQQPRDNASGKFVSRMDDVQTTSLTSVTISKQMLSKA